LLGIGLGSWHHDLVKGARAWFAATALAALAGIVIQLPVTAGIRNGFFSSTPARVLNVFAYFTVESNLIVAVTCLLLALRPVRASPVFAAARLTGIVAITITGIVYHVALAKLLDLNSWALVADQLLHTVVPVLAVTGWLAFGPRGLATLRTAAWALVFPVAWLGFTLVRGALIGWYPYPFIDVTTLGYGRALANTGWVALVFFGIAAGAAALDRRLRPAGS
jgi:hypothetical protein